MNKLFTNWMNEPGSQKALQLYLSISILICIFLITHIIDLNLKIHHLKNPETNLKTKAETPLPTEEELKIFLYEYLKKMFELNESSFEFINEHTEAAFWENNLSKEIRIRQNKKINSFFKIQSLYIESLDISKAKAVCFGKEIFPEKNFTDRNLLVELIFKTRDLKVVSIPVFRIE